MMFVFHGSPHGSPACALRRLRVLVRMAVVGGSGLWLAMVGCWLTVTSCCGGRVRVKQRAVNPCCNTEQQYSLSTHCGAATPRPPLHRQVEGIKILQTAFNQRDGNSTTFGSIHARSTSAIVLTLTQVCPRVLNLNCLANADAGPYCLCGMRTFGACTRERVCVTTPKVRIPHTHIFFEDGCTRSRQRKQSNLKLPFAPTTRKGIRGRRGWRARPSK